MAIAHSKLTRQGQISVPAEVRRKLGVGPGSVIEWVDEGGRVVVRHAGRYSSDDIHKALSEKAMPVQLPIGANDTFEGVVDLTQRYALRFAGEGREVRVGEIPAGLAAAAKSAREKLDEAVATSDDKLIEEYIETGTICA